MSFGLVPASPYVDGATRVTATSLNFYRTAITQTIDTVNGGTYNIAGGHEIKFASGGGDWNFACALTATNIVSASFTALATVTGLVHFLTGSELLVDSGTTAIFNNTVAFNGLVNVTNLLTVAAGAGIFLAASGSPAGGGTLAALANSSITLAGTASLTAAVASVVILNGTNTIAGTTTISGTTTITGPTSQTSPWTKTGIGGYVIGRQQAVANVSTTLNPGSFDTIFVGANGADLNGVTYTLSSPASTSTPDGVRCHIVAPLGISENSGSWTVTGLNGGGSFTTFTFNVIGGGGSHTYQTSNYIVVETIGGKWACLAAGIGS